jgi:hypothetical protein
MLPELPRPGLCFGNDDHFHPMGANFYDSATMEPVLKQLSVCTWKYHAHQARFIFKKAQA